MAEGKGKSTPPIGIKQGKKRTRREKRNTCVQTREYGRDHRPAGAGGLTRPKSKYFYLRRMMMVRETRTSSRVCARSRTLVSVDLPPPEGPTSARVSPEETVTDTDPSTLSFGRVGYENPTCAEQCFAVAWEMRCDVCPLRGECGAMLMFVRGASARRAATTMHQATRSSAAGSTAKQHRDGWMDGPRQGLKYKRSF